jgi:NADH-quinone oxidoreductase subunit L
VLSAIGGFIGIPELFAKNGNKFGDFLSPVFARSKQLLPEHTVPHQTEWILIIVSALLVIIVSIWAWNKFKNYAPSTEADNSFVKVIRNKFYIDEAYDMLFVKPYHSLGTFLNNVFDKKGIDGIVNGVGRSVNYGSRQLRLLQSGQVGSYLLLMVVGLLILFIIQLFTK